MNSFASESNLADVGLGTDGHSNCNAFRAAFFRIHNHGHRADVHSAPDTRANFVSPRSHVAKTEFSVRPSLTGRNSGLFGLVFPLIGLFLGQVFAVIEQFHERVADSPAYLVLDNPLQSAIRFVVHKDERCISAVTSSLLRKCFGAPAVRQNGRRGSESDCSEDG